MAEPSPMLRIVSIVAAALMLQSCNYSYHVLAR